MFPFLNIWAHHRNAARHWKPLPGPKYSTWLDGSLSSLCFCTSPLLRLLLLEVRRCNNQHLSFLVQEVPGAEDFQHFLWPSSTSADTRLAHSSISSEFRLNRRRLLSSSSTAAQADNGQGVIEYKSVGFNIDGADFATFFSRAYANQRATGKPLPLSLHALKFPAIYKSLRSLSAPLKHKCLSDRSVSWALGLKGWWFKYNNPSWISLLRSCAIHGVCRRANQPRHVPCVTEH